MCHRSRVDNFILNFDHAQQDFDVAVRLGDSRAQMALLDNFRCAPEFSGQRLLRLARLCMDGNTPDRDVTCAALNAALARLLENMPHVPYDLVGKVCIITPELRASGLLTCPLAVNVCSI